MCSLLLLDNFYLWMLKTHLTDTKRSFGKYWIHFVEETDLFINLPDQIQFISK